jgi:hypothetical protein
MDCPHCSAPVFRLSEDGSKLKARTRILVLHKSGGSVEINCHSCGRGVILPLALSPGDFQIKKAAAPRFVARRS